MDTQEIRMCPSMLLVLFLSAKHKVHWRQLLCNLNFQEINGWNHTVTHQSPKSAWGNCRHRAGWHNKYLEVGAYVVFNKYYTKACHNLHLNSTWECHLVHGTFFLWMSSRFSAAQANSWKYRQCSNNINWVPCKILLLCWQIPYIRAATTCHTQGHSRRKSQEANISVSHHRTGR
jgi:hypothetical protein